MTRIVMSAKAKLKSEVLMWLPQKKEQKSSRKSWDDNFFAGKICSIRFYVAELESDVLFT